MNAIRYKPIGIIHSPFKEPKGMPIQPVGAKNISGWIDMEEEFREGLEDLDGFSHIYLIFHLNLSKSYSLKVKPFLDNTLRGVFATRAPRRPNSIGLSVVRLDRIEGTRVYISNIDIVDGTPLLDIKPYVPDFDDRKDVRIGWLENKSKRAAKKRLDESFLKG